VRDANRQALAYVYFRDNENDAGIAKVLRRGKTHSGEYRQPTRIAEALTLRHRRSMIRRGRGTSVAVKSQVPK
jgi:hypothetical protein